MNDSLARAQARLEAARRSMLRASLDLERALSARGELPPTAGEKRRQRLQGKREELLDLVGQMNADERLAASVDDLLAGVEGYAKRAWDAVREKKPAKGESRQSFARRLHSTAKIPEVKPTRKVRREARTVRNYLFYRCRCRKPCSPPWHRRIGRCERSLCGNYFVRLKANQRFCTDGRTRCANRVSARKATEDARAKKREDFSRRLRVEWNREERANRRGKWTPKKHTEAKRRISLRMGVTPTLVTRRTRALTGLPEES